MKTWLICSLALLTAACQKEAASKPAPAAPVAEQAAITSLLLPINWVAIPHYNLSLKVPAGFRPLQTITDWSNTENPNLEFIPQHEDENNWTQIITLSKYIGKQFSAEDVNAYLKQRILALATNGKVLEEKTVQEGDYQSSFLALSYDLNGKHEIMAAQYYSGPYDTAGIQYTIRSSSDEQALDTIKAFLATNTEVIHTQQ